MTASIDGDRACIGSLCDGAILRNAGAGEAQVATAYRGCPQAQGGDSAQRDVIGATVAEENIAAKAIVTLCQVDAVGAGNESACTRDNPCAAGL